MGTLHDNQQSFVITSCSVLLRMGNVSDKWCRKIKTQIPCSHIFFSKILQFMR